MELTARCVRTDRWWVVRVPEIRGLFTQTARLDQVEAAVLDAASLLDDQPAEGFHVTVEVDFADGQEQAITRARKARARAYEAQAEVADADKQAITKLHHDGLTARDIGNLLGVSHQRVHQILKAA